MYLPYAVLIKKLLRLCFVSTCLTALCLLDLTFMILLAAISDSDSQIVDKKESVFAPSC